MSYEALSSSYDGLMTDVCYPRRVRQLEKHFKKSAIPVRTVLDLACGTGTVSCLLAEAGYAVTATDGSEEMLTQAMQKAAGLERPPLFVCQSMPALRLPEQVDAVVSTVDSLNYLTRERDLKETFRRVYGALKPGGRFLFDVNTPYKLRRMDQQIYMDETEESFCVWRTFFSEKQQVCTYQVDLFQLRPDGSWDRDFEEHRERAWSREQLETFLTEVGFVQICFTGDLSAHPPAETEDRWNVLCEKPKEKNKE